MAESGVEKYDQLPATVGVIDVDAWRYVYAKTKLKLARAETALEQALILHESRKVRK